MKIYEREYDNPRTLSGDEKPNKFLGDFKIIQTIAKDFYSSMRTGRNKKDGQVYLIIEREASGTNGGSVFSVIRLKSLWYK